MKKRIFALVLVIALALSLTACSSAGKSGSTDEKELTLGVIDDDNKTYTNEFLGLKCQLDESWDIFDAQQMAQLQGVVADLLSDTDLSEQLNDAGTAQIFYAQAEGGLKTVNIVIENMGILYGSLMDEKEYAEAGVEQIAPAFEGIGLTEINTNITSMKFAGKDHTAITLHGSLGGTDFYETIICYKIGNYIANITAGSYTSDATNDILAMFSKLS